MTNYKEKALHHIKRKTNNRFILEFNNTFILEFNNTFKTIDLIFNSVKFDTLKVFTDWESAYKFLKEFTKSTKRSWIERVKKQDNTIWDTDLEPEEQECVDHLLEWFDYDQGCFEFEELLEIFAESIEEEVIANACDILIKALQKHNKTTIEVE